MEAIGAVDEANSAIGIAVSATADSERRSALTRIQNDLFDVGADLCVRRAGVAPLRRRGVARSRRGVTTADPFAVPYLQ